MRRGIARVVLAATVAVIMSCEPPSTAPLSPTQEHYGRTYGAWGAEWWRFVSEFYPITNHPILDRTGDNCLVGQTDNRSVLFLFGTFGATVTRRCTISSSQAIFFPLVNGTFDNSGVDPANLQTSEQWRVQAEGLNASLAGLFLDVDGTHYGDAELRAYIIPPEHFSYMVPPLPNLYSEVYGAPWTGDVPDAWSAGAWILLPPLPVGQHTIHFGGSTVDSSGMPTFSTDVSYILTVQ